MKVQLIECPRDAMQGWPTIIDRKIKTNYLNLLMKAGFHTLDCGSFVSPKAIPQMADTKEVLDQIDMSLSDTKLLAIVANARGAAEAVQIDKLSYLGFPFSISPEFQRRNANSSLEESLERVDIIQDLCIMHGKELVIYMSMAFGNPYGDAYSADILLEWIDRIVNKEIGIISLADTVGMANAIQVETAVKQVSMTYPDITVGVHLHAASHNFEDKLSGAWNAGCRRFDGALKGVGGCPMAQDNLVGNMASEKIINWLHEKHKIDTGIDRLVLAEALNEASKIFH
jgi:hydroxymethylglutaryl-CoA lyase